MPTIVEFPTVVKEALEVFGDLFDNEPERRHFAEYLTGLIVAESKTVSGINRAFVVTTDQSCLNHWLTEVDWDVKALNGRRLEWLQADPKTRHSSRGVIAIDNTLVDHDGNLIEDVGWLWDRADGRYVIAHDYVISNYVCPSGAHYPIEWRRFKKREAGAGGEFFDHTQLCIELIDDAVQRQIPGDFTFDGYFTSADVLNHIHGKERGYVGDLKLNRKVVYEGREQKLNAVAARGIRSFHQRVLRSRGPEIVIVSQGEYALMHVEEFAALLGYRRKRVCNLCPVFPVLSGRVRRPRIKRRTLPLVRPRKDCLWLIPKCLHHVRNNC